MLRKFPSIAQSGTHAYAYDSEAWDSKSIIDCHFRMFETYGDGLCQHSRDWSITVEYFGDYLASLAAAMLVDQELAQQLYYTIHRQPTVKEIEFAASVIYKAPKENVWNAKRKYYSREEKKITSAESKRHDKRYEEVTDRHDGSPDSIYRILIPEYADCMQRYAYAEAIRAWALQQDGMYMPLAAEFLKWFNDDPQQREKSSVLRKAFEMCSEITEACRLRSSVESTLDNYRHNIEVKQAKVAEPEEEKIA